MIKGFYAAVSGMVTNANRQELLSHNIANLDTPGFKQVLVSIEDFMETGVASSANRYIGELGLGAMTTPEVIDFGQGALESTGNQFDLAIQGDGFFRIETPDGERYTRDGRFLRDSEGTLITTEGFSVLDDAGQPITLPDGEIEISPAGLITSAGEEIGSLGIAFFSDPGQQLTVAHGNLYSSETEPDGEGTADVAQYYLEMSNADPAQIMAQLMQVARSYEAAQKMVQNQDDLLGKTISSLGRLA
jgi:flagellar basal-body rod protein FlgF